MAESVHRDQFVLKGATLFDLWHDAVHRATRDVDLLGKGEPAVDRMQAAFRELGMLDVEPEGLQFLDASVRAKRIRGGQAYGGVRVRLVADLGGARIAVQVDIGFGDAVTPVVPVGGAHGMEQQRHLQSFDIDPLQMLIAWALGHGMNEAAAILRRMIAKARHESWDDDSPRIF